MWNKHEKEQYLSRQYKKSIEKVVAFQELLKNIYIL